MPTSDELLAQLRGQNRPTDFGLRANGTQKGQGFFGKLELPDGGFATEFSIGVQFDGKETQIPTLVPTLTKGELSLMVNDIIPNRKQVPRSIIQKAVNHAKLRISQGQSPFKEITPTTSTDLLNQLRRQQPLSTQFLSSRVPLRTGQNVPLAQQSIEQLLGSVGPRMPRARPEAPAREPSLLTEDGFFLGNLAASEQRLRENKRKKDLLTVQELQFRGMSLQDIEERLDPTFVEQLKSDIGRTAGGVGGGIAGAKGGAVIGTAIAPGAGTFIGGLLGAGIGAGLAGFVGEDVQNTIEMVQIGNKTERGERLTFGERNLIDRTEKEIASERRQAAAGEAIFELVGRVGIGAIGKVFRRPFARAVLPEVLEFSDEFARFGGQFSPAQLVEGTAAKSKLTAFFADFIDTLESIGEKGFGGRGIFKRFRVMKQILPYEKLIKSTADDVVKTTIRMTPEQKAVMLFDVINNRKTAYKGIRNSLYRWARKANNGQDVLVSIEPLERFLDSTKRSVSGKLGRTELGESLIKKLDDIIAQVNVRGRVRDPLGTGRFVSGKQMTIVEVEDMLVGLNSELRALAKAGDTPGKRIATIAKDIMTREARKAEKGLEPEVFRRLRVAKKFVREGQPIFEEQFIKKLVDPKTGLGNNPEILNKILFPNKNTAQVTRAKELIVGTGKFAVGENKRRWDNLALGWLEDAIEGSISPADGFFKPARFQTKIKALGERSIDIMFEPAIAKRIKNIPKLGNILARETAGGGSLAIRIGQVGAVGALVSGREGIKATATGILIGPSLIALLFTSDTGIKALTTGLRAKPGSKEAAAAVVRMIGIVNRLRKQRGIVEERKRRVPEPRLLGGFKR